MVLEMLCPCLGRDILSGNRPGAFTVSFFIGQVAPTSSLAPRLLEEGAHFMPLVINLKSVDSVEHQGPMQLFESTDTPRGAKPR